MIDLEFIKLILSYVPKLCIKFRHQIEGASYI